MLIPRGDVELVDRIKRQGQEFVLVLPANILLLEVLSFLRWRGRLCNLGDEISSGGFRNTVYEHTQERDLEEHEKGHSEAVEDALTIVEPEPFLLRVVADTREVWLKLKSVSECP